MKPLRLSFIAAAFTAAPLMAAQPAIPVQSYPAAQADATLQLPLPVIPGLTVPAGASGQSVQFPFPIPASTEQSQNAQKWLERMGDFTQNATTLKDPNTFMQWVATMTDPAIVGASMDAAMEPGYWIRTVQSMMQPSAVTHYMGLLDPRVTTSWFRGMMDPVFFQKNLSSMTDPAKMMRWMLLPQDPKFFQASLNMMNPNTYMKWMMAPMDPRVWGLMFAPMNPQLYGSMAGAVVNPSGMGESWEKFMKPKHPVVSLMPPAPVNLPFNVLDPSTYGNILGVLAGFLPAGAQQMFSSMVPGGAQTPGSASIDQSANHQPGQDQAEAPADTQATLGEPATQDEPAQTDPAQATPTPTLQVDVPVKMP